MPKYAYQVFTKFATSDMVFDDCVVGADSIGEARDYVSERYSASYGFEPGQAPVEIRVKRISNAKAEDMVDAGAIDWYH